MPSTTSRLSVREGEIVGLYGLMGAGRTEFLECIMAQHPHATGQLLHRGQAAERERDVAERIARGLALIPEDRKRDGLIQIMAIRENLTLSSLGDFARGFHLGLRPKRRAAADFVKRLTIKVASAENPVSASPAATSRRWSSARR